MYLSNISNNSSTINTMATQRHQKYVKNRHKLDNTDNTKTSNNTNENSRFEVKNSMLKNQFISLAVTERMESTSSIFSINLSLPTLPDVRGLQKHKTDNYATKDDYKKDKRIFKYSEKLGSMVNKLKEIKKINRDVATQEETSIEKDLLISEVFSIKIKHENKSKLASNKQKLKKQEETVDTIESYGWFKDPFRLKKNKTNSFESLSSLANTPYDSDKIIANLSNELNRRTDSVFNVLEDERNPDLGYNYISVTDYHNERIQKEREERKKQKEKLNSNDNNTNNNENNKAIKLEVNDNESFSDFLQDKPKGIVNIHNSQTQTKYNQTLESSPLNAHLDPSLSPKISPAIKDKVLDKNKSPLLFKKNSFLFNPSSFKLSKLDTKVNTESIQALYMNKRNSSFMAYPSHRLSKRISNFAIPFSSVNELEESEIRYLNYIKKDFNQRKLEMSVGYLKYLQNLKFTSELRLKKIVDIETSEHGSLMDVLSLEILKNIKTNFNSTIYKSLERNENMIFGTFKDETIVSSKKKEEITDKYLVDSVHDYRKMIERLGKKKAKMLDNKLFNREQINFFIETKKEFLLQKLKEKFSLQKVYAHSTKAKKKKK